MNEFWEVVPVWGLVALVGLTCVSGFFSASETAIFYLSREELRSFRIGTARQRIVADLLRDPDRLLISVLFWNLITNLSYFAVSVVVTQRLASRGLNAAAGIFGVATLLWIIVFGEVLPKSLAVVFRRGLASLVGPPVAASVRILDPVTPVLRKVTTIARRAFWPNLTVEPHLHTEDLERAIEATEASEDVIRHERHVLSNVLELTEITVEEVMRPRGTYQVLKPPIHLSALQGQPPPGDVIVIAEEDNEIAASIPLTTFSAVPQEHLENAAEGVIYVPWCANLAYTLQQLRDRFANVAAVVNEYGETTGIVTYDDILDTILLSDATRAHRVLRREPVLEIAPGRYHVEGITTLRYLARRLGIEDYDPDEEEQVTVAGLLHQELEHIPEVGDECVWEGHRIRVIDVYQRVKLRAMVSKDEVESAE